MRTIKRIALAAVVGIVGVGLYLAVVGYFTFSRVDSFSQRSMELQQLRMDNVTRFLSVAASDYLYRNEKTRLSILMNQVARGQDVLFGGVVSPRGFVLAHTDPMVIGEKSADAFPQMASEDTRVVKTPVFIGETEIGSVTMGFSLTSTRAAIAAVRVETIFAGSLAAGLGSLFLFPLLFGTVFIRLRMKDVRAVSEEHKISLQKVEEQISKKNRQMELLTSLHGMMRSESTPDRVVNRALSYVMDGLDLGIGWVLMRDKEKNNFQAIAHKGLGDIFQELQEGIQNGKGEYYKQMLAEGTARLLPELPSTHPLFGMVPKTSGGKDQGLLEIPLQGRDDHIGVLGFIGANANPLSPDEKKFLEDLGKQIGSLIENALRFDKTRRKYSALSSLHRASQSLLEAAGYTELLQAISRNTVELLSARRAALFLYDKRKNGIVGVAGYGIWDAEVRQFQGSPSALIAQAIEEKKPVQVAPLPPEKRAEDPYLTRFDLLSVLILPLAIRTRTIGVLIVDDIWRERQFTSEEISIAMAFARQAATSLKKVPVGIPPKKGLLLEESVSEILTQ